MCERKRRSNEQSQDRLSEEKSDGSKITARQKRTDQLRTEGKGYEPRRTCDQPERKKSQHEFVEMFEEIKDDEQCRVLSLPRSPQEFEPCTSCIGGLDIQKMEGNRSAGNDRNTRGVERRDGLQRTHDPRSSPRTGVA